ncbi:capsular biosynthesis protein [Pseudomonas cerasi]
MKKLIVDIDNTITRGKGDLGYEDALVNLELVEKLREYKNAGYSIVLNTSRNMNTHNNNVGKINKETLPTIIKWLELNNIPFDEIYVGKPWCGTEGFYIDDKAIRPDEFISKTHEEIIDLIGGGN